VKLTRPGLAKKAVVVFPFVRLLEQMIQLNTKTIGITGYINHDHRMLRINLKGIAGNLLGSYKYLFEFSFLYVLGDTPFILLKI
jgi:hypothetical protein